MEHRVDIQWTDTAKRQLVSLPPEVRRGLLTKADNLRHCDDPRKACKPLVGPLAGYYRITYARYRAIYLVEEDKLASGDVFVRVRVLFAAAGKRKERDREDIYKIAEKMLHFGMIDPISRKESDESSSP